MLILDVALVSKNKQRYGSKWKAVGPNDSIIRLMRSFYLQFAMLNVKKLQI